MKIGKYCGRLLTVTGVLHIIVMLFIYASTYLSIFQDKIIDSIGDNAQRNAALWAIMIGILLVLWGETLQCYQNETSKPAPLFIGYGILSFSVIGCILMPVSGFWLFIPQAIIIIAANKINWK